MAVKRIEVRSRALMPKRYFTNRWIEAALRLHDPPAAFSVASVAREYVG
ncbi:MAG: hypothetical protein ABI488_19510 [Polyangiaceae bacterium]